VLISLALFASLIALSYSYWWRKTQIKRWRRTLQLDKHLPIFQRLFAHVDGFALSQKARAQHDAMEYVYGEIDFLAFVALLSLVQPDANTIFYDLGSGTGKAVMACAMVFNVKKSCGIELFHELHHSALKQQQRLVKLPSYMKKAQTIHFINHDFLIADFNEATLIFINATGLFGASWEALNDRLAHTAMCQTVITTSKKLTTKAFTVSRITNVQMSWGVVNAYIQHRVY